MEGADLYIFGNFVNIKSLILCARQLGMDFLTCAFILPIVMNNLSYCKLSKQCGNSTDFKKQTATPFVPSVSISTQLKDCRVVLEDISFSCGAAKLQMLDPSQDKTHMTDSHHTT